ncbi:MAG: hypothetical protein ABFR19_03310 [Pseudomonadota bacterium]
MRTRLLIPLLLATLAIFPAAVAAEKFTDWVVECKGTSVCAATTSRQGGTTEGYPSIKITGKDRGQRKLFLADTKYADSTKKISIRIDNSGILTLKPKRDFRRQGNGEYLIVNAELQRKLLSRMASGRTLQLIYTNVRGQKREPEYSLMGMGAALNRLAKARPPASVDKVVSKKPEKSAQQVNARSGVKKKYRNWQVRCAADGSCAATTYRARGSIDGYPVIKVVVDSNNRRQLHIDSAQHVNGSKPVWIRVDNNKEIRLQPGKDFSRLSKNEYKITNSRALTSVMSVIRKGRELRLSYRNVRGQWRQPKYSLLGATAAMNALGGGTSASPQPPAKKVAVAEPAEKRKPEVAARRTKKDPAPKRDLKPSVFGSAVSSRDDRREKQRDSFTWWDRITTSGERWNVNCSGGSRCAAAAQGRVKGKKDISMHISGRSAGLHRVMLAKAGMLDTSKPMRIQVDGSLPLHLVPRKDFKQSGRDAVRLVNSRLSDTLIAKMRRGDEMWVTYTNRSGRPRVVKFSLSGLNTSLKKLAR